MPITPTTAAIVVTILGFCVSMLISAHVIRNQKETSNKKVRTWLAGAITLIWASAVIADIVVTGYTVSPLVHAIMGAMVGYFFTEDGISFLDNNE